MHLQIIKLKLLRWLNTIFHKGNFDILYEVNDSFRSASGPAKILLLGKILL